MPENELHAAVGEGRLADLADGLRKKDAEGTLAAALAERDSLGRTPLHCAAWCRQPEGAAAGGGRLLVAAGADATAKTSGFGETALHHAAEIGPDDPSLAGLLLGAGCDPAAKDNIGKTALDYAKQRKKSRTAAVLKAAAAEPEATLAPFRAEVAALKQEGMRYVVKHATLPAGFDQALPEGSAIHVQGKGRGAYVSFNKKTFGANEHTIAFDSGSTAVVNLKTERWTVKESEMAALEQDLEPEPEPEPEPERTREPEIPLQERAAAARASPRWIPDGEVGGCMLCAKSFSPLKSKKHHCRFCGWLVCASCSPTSMPLERWLDSDKPHALHTEASAEAQRVCNLCLQHLLSGGGAAAGPAAGAGAAGGGGLAEGVPVLPLASRTLVTSNFRAAYRRAQAPADPLTLGMLLGDLIRGHCRKEGIPWEGEGAVFHAELSREVMANAQELTSAASIPTAVQRMWTSALQLRDREFCSILNAAVRDDDPALQDSAATLTRAINQMCVTFGQGAEAHPPNDECFRGGGFDDQFRGFFTEGKKFRQPAFLATSFARATADDFIARVPEQYPKVRWLVRIDPVRKCVHVNLVTKRVPGLPDEQEYLFAPYSAFTVLSVRWNAGTVAAPHEIELLAAVDNRDAPEDLPLAPWS